MKKYIFLLAAAIFTGCSSDYLDTTPTSSTSPNTLYSTTDNAKVAINGLAKLMIKQYQSQGFNGEGTIKMYYGNYSGKYFYKDLPGWANTQNFMWVNSNDASYTNYPWHYYYMLIGNANPLIEQIDNAVGTEAERQFIKAQALTYRAYAYTQLCQIYGQRWKDSDNGSQPALVLRVNSGKEPLPLSPLADIYTQIYTDLNEAIQLFESSKMEREKNNFYEPNINVAYATYARAALNKEDFTSASKYAQLARKDFPLMSNDDYKSGFNTPNSEWIWGCYNAPDETLYYYSFHSYMGYNSTAGAVRNTPGCISRVLYNKIPDTDLRKNLFLNPGKDYIPVNSGQLALTGDNKNPDDIALNKEYRELFPELQKNAKLYKYMQFKFKVTEQPGVGNLNNFRSAEMYLIEAESLHKLGKDTEAQKLMNELVQPRDPEYKCTATGKDLFEEIKLYRFIELWGEGFDWFDLKRWGDSRVRNTFKDIKNKENEKEQISDDLYDQYPSTLARTIAPDQNNNWVYVTPIKESDYNPEIK